MNQQSYKFDSVTLHKIGRSALIALVGIILTSGTFLGQELINYLANGDAIDWNTMLIMSLSAIGAWMTNTLKEWIQGGEEEEDLPLISNK